MIGFEDYAKIKNNYCLTYVGHSAEFLVQLRLLRPHIERLYTDLRLTIGCRDEMVNWVGDRHLKASELKARRHEFAFMRTLEFDGINHPVEQFLDECDKMPLVIHSNPVPSYGIGLILPGLSDVVVRNIKKFYQEKNYRIDEGEYRHADFVIGKESPEFYDIAGSGVASVLVGNTLGTRLYKKMFPAGENLRG